ncbi:MAG: manganese efflux pump [Firmicutes bacterium]|nr:manganese efflux pump [Bacillota bacterium]
MYIGQILFTGFLILFGTSLDIFALGFGYGAKKDIVSWRSLIIVSFISSIFLLIALLLGFFLGEWLPSVVSHWLGFGLLMTVGLWRIAAWLASRKREKKPHSIVSTRELLLVAVMLSIDGMAIGVGAAIGAVTLAFIFAVFAISIVTDILMFRLGQGMGRALAERLSWDLGWVGGVLLIIVAIAGLFI